MRSRSLIFERLRAGGGRVAAVSTSIVGANTIIIGLVAGQARVRERRDLASNGGDLREIHVVGGSLDLEPVLVVALWVRPRKVDLGFRHCLRRKTRRRARR